MQRQVQRQGRSSQPYVPRQAPPTERPHRGQPSRPHGLDIQPPPEWPHRGQPSTPYGHLMQPPSPTEQQYGGQDSPTRGRPEQPSSPAAHQSQKPLGMRMEPPLDRSSRGRPSQPQDQPAQRPRYQGQPFNQQGSLVPPPRYTKPITWFVAVFCAVFWVVVILGGLIVLIVYLVFRPRSPRFDVSSVTLNAAYLDMGYLLNADLTLLANFTNPNKKVSVDFSYMVINLYYGKTLLATRSIYPFTAARTQTMFANVEMIASQVALPMEESLRLARQMERDRIVFEVKGLFRTRSNLGSFLRYSYWLYGRCRLVLTRPPTGVLVSSKCKTKR
ncbi:NDR1/HIN1-like protein 6 isoform X2 [Malania oleifera]|uniref:NDR1/HIN1-like protein 6 isoform X2 n=1 Tax=Malania oleifera TaxID=397392 RepID=UPI0025AE083A|nr:NDR1/HIN1-like protein 6 isoform X2 [Malania oleifera]